MMDKHTIQYLEARGVKFPNDMKAAAGMQVCAHTKAGSAWISADMYLEAKRIGYLIEKEQTDAAKD